MYTPSNTQRSSDALSQPVRTSYALGNSLEYKLLGSLVPYAEDDSLADFKTSGEMATVHLPEPEGLLLPVAAALSLLPPLPKRNSCCPSPPQKDFQLEDINHSKLSNQSPNPERGNQRVELSPSTSSGTSGSTIYEERQQRRKRDEQLATEAISALFSQKSLQPTSRDDDLPVRPSLLSLRLPNLRALSDTVEIPSAQVTTTQESLQKLGSPFQVKPVSPSHKSFQGGAFRKTFYHPRRPTKPINLAEICLNEPHIQGRRPRVEQRPKSLISVQEELSGNERQPGYNPSSLSQNVTNRKSSAYYDFI